MLENNPIEPIDKACYVHSTHSPAYKHLNFFNTIAASTAVPHACNPSVYLYRHKIISALNTGESLSLMAEGASGGCFAPPSEAQDNRLEKKYKNLDRFQADLVNCIMKR
jgi:hypothetical protein